MIYQLTIAQRNPNVTMSSEYPKPVYASFQKCLQHESRVNPKREKIPSMKDLKVITTGTFCIVCECKSNTKNQQNGFGNP